MQEVLRQEMIVSTGHFRGVLREHAYVLRHVFLRRYVLAGWPVCRMWYVLAACCRSMSGRRSCQKDGCAWSSGGALVLLRVVSMSLAEDLARLTCYQTIVAKLAGAFDSQMMWTNVMRGSS